MSTVLIVDDNEQNLYLLDVLLRRNGFVVHSATNGHEALVQARKELPDVIVSDILMPVMDGFTLCRKWKKDPQLACVPFIFYTATYTEEQDRQFALSLGADRFIIKPADPIEFVTIVKQVVLEQTIRPEPTAASEAVEDDNAYLQTYNQTLIRKLEQKMVTLEEAYRQLNALKDAVDQSAVGLMIVDEEGTVVWISRAVKGMFHFKTADVLEKPLAQVLEQQLGHHFVQPELFVHHTMAAQSDKGALKRLEYELHPAAQTPLWLEHHIVPIPAGLYQGGWLHYFYDITKRKQAAERLYLREKQLRQTQRLEAMGRLATGMAHDFKNLLTVINAYGDLIARNPDVGQEKILGYVHHILQSTDKAAELIQKLLAFGRQQEVELALVNLNGVVQNVYELLKPVTSKGIELQISLENGLWAVEADPSHMEQAVLNLALNACDAMPSGGTLTVRTANLSVREEDDFVDVKPGDYVLILVNDTGLGMDEQTRSRIFEPFFTTKRDSGGTGLGLAMVHGTIMQIGGQILVESEPDFGTTFKIYLPFYPHKES